MRSMPAVAKKSAARRRKPRAGAVPRSCRACRDGRTRRAGPRRSRSGAAQDRIVSTARAEGLGAVAELDLGPQTGQALGALGDSFLDGMRPCLMAAGSLTLLAALAAVVLLGRPRQRPTVEAAGHTADEKAAAVQGA